jgi:hypothetical protein
MMKRAIRMGGCLLLLASGWAATARAADPDVEPSTAVATATEDLEPKAHTEGYFGFLIPIASVQGDFDGDKGFTTPDGTGVIPDLKTGAGFGLVVGLKHDGTSGKGLALEGSLQGTHHDASAVGGFSSSADLALISGDVKLFPMTRGSLQPWIQLGLCAASMRVKNGFFRSTGGQKDLTYTGTGLDVGTGLLFYATPRVALHAAAIYRFIRYDEVDYGTRARFNDDLKGGTLSVELGATLRFNRH